VKIKLPLKGDQELTTGTEAIASAGTIEARILLIRGHKVILDADLAELYGVGTKALTRAVRRNPERFPGDFMLQLSPQEFANLRRQYGTSSQWGERRYPPFAFTEQGVAMLSSVLRSKRAVLVNVEIMRGMPQTSLFMSASQSVASPSGGPGAHENRVDRISSAVSKQSAMVQWGRRHTR
jgi:hypothetical protein